MLEMRQRFERRQVGDMVGVKIKAGDGGPFKRGFDRPVKGWIETCIIRVTSLT